MSIRLDLSGQVYGRLTAVRQSSADRFGRSIWLCVCACGTPTGILEVAANNLRTGHTKSCGCVTKERRATGSSGRKHGHASIDDKKHSSRTYASWRAMKQRCTNPKSTGYEIYGGRGVRVCNQWLGRHGFDEFLKDMGERPDGATLDRFPNNNGNYEPSNCRWATWHEQSKNRRPRRKFTH